MQTALFNHSGKWLLGWGIVFSLLGIAAIVAASFTTLLTVVTLGGLLLLTGTIILINSFHFWWSKETGFTWQFIIGALYFLFGLVCLLNPILAAASFTLILSVVFIIVGMSRIIYAQNYKFPGYSWSLLSGILALLLGILIIMQWPSSSLFIIGLFVGVDLLFLGWSYIMFSLIPKP